MCEYKNGVLILSVCHNVEDRTHYALGYMEYVPEEEARFQWFTEVRFNSDTLRKYSITSNDICKLRMIVCGGQDGSEEASLSNHGGALLVLSSSAVSVALDLFDRSDKQPIEVRPSHILRMGETTYGAACLNNLCHVFLKDSGFALLRLVPMKFDVSFDSSRMLKWITNLHAKELKESKNPRHLLINSFVRFCKKNFDESERFLRRMEAYPTGEVVDIIMNFAIFVLDGVVTRDGFWDESETEKDIPMNKSLKMIRFLDGKLQFFNMLICYLKYVGLYDKMATIKRSYDWSSKSVAAPAPVMRTAVSYVIELEEKLIILNVLYEWVSEANVPFFDTVVRTLLHKNDLLDKHPGLHNYDVFFSNVSTFGMFLEMLVLCEAAELRKSDDVTHHFRVIFENGGIVQKILDAVTTYRCSPDAIRVEIENRWTSMPVIIRSFNIHLAHIAQLLETDSRNLGEQFSILVGHAFAVSQFVLGQQSREQRNESIVIERFLKLGEREKAIELAEEFEDFTTLIRETLKDQETRQDKFEYYKQRFAASNFAVILMKYYLKHRMIPELLSEPGEEAEEFVLNNDSLAWTRQTQNGSFDAAAATLQKLTNKHNGRKRHIALVLGKLNALCAEHPNHDLIQKFSDDIKASRLNQAAEDDRQKKRVSL
ncbi:hypothetical protein L596_028515 [Steinernema carpocapsae]|uniref:Nucleoporin Nup133/Nup155-like C-terminal domain-containing protein n=1 Tax=Steinernema carpocapsae TaxID=34508 RepID=A0A4V5ZXX4_STECR|nr:hypothetical protein L596_028515 [Steinernema carpocapsae]